MKKEFQVDVDITMSKAIFVEAENEEQAKNIVNNWLGDDVYYYLKGSSYVGHEITDVNED